ncbi:hypothetical protein Fleli_0456 [Bernardetia litoralis DSM 6794]|uniref:Uncharacterized protein n=1 Tax=Bernardetia litoralis (strain ATCC 23117 / DSM 6794 / NBRC 15988 / NCIMB 1366 / Fx l1 / Sio-4) TaxID=880071 RepID=I4AG47_BERLS|nr:hypothetical protein Fleli_0456 [Bernardetia litoralis DSM 6794]
MIDKNWFNLEKCRIVDEYIEDGIEEVSITRKNRNFQLLVCEYESRKKSCFYGY